ncbi:hypothetical protein QBC34DRAFT_28265 [Podospora aff. communis PSN243]|uniref:Uncharacterized protein n=1 Tax=Podospora aff. communis PSN243 TaxID=3040156 RepID=A0AAV9GVK4_9PEZI|nr:hypothetical protein QBC34DRAFT_28265 [Podospora aff. communis PSN243]
MERTCNPHPSPHLRHLGISSASPPRLLDFTITGYAFQIEPQVPLKIMPCDAWSDSAVDFVSFRPQVRHGGTKLFFTANQWQRAAAFGCDVTTGSSNPPTSLRDLGGLTESHRALANGNDSWGFRPATGISAHLDFATDLRTISRQSRVQFAHEDDGLSGDQSSGPATSDRLASCNELQVKWQVRLQSTEVRMAGRLAVRPPASSLSGPAPCRLTALAPQLSHHNSPAKRITGCRTNTLQDAVRT